MDQKQTPRDPHGDNALIDGMIAEATPGQSGTEGGRLAAEIGSIADEETATGADPEPVRAHKGEKAQPAKTLPGGTIGD